MGGDYGFYGVRKALKVEEKLRLIKIEKDR